MIRGLRIRRNFLGEAFDFAFDHDDGLLLVTPWFVISSGAWRDADDVMLRIASMA